MIGRVGWHDLFLEHLQGESDNGPVFKHLLVDVK